jgi:membrane-bound lytic murein transglycosylase D
MHVVKRGETLSQIANRYGLSAGLLQEVNKVRSIRSLRIGQVLAIPVPSSIISSQGKVPFDYDAGRRSVSFKSSSSRTRRAMLVATPPKNKAKLLYTVRKGDTIGDIAEWYGVRASDIRNWNGISYGRHIYPDQRLSIWVDPTKKDRLEEIERLSYPQKQSLLAGKGGGKRGASKTPSRGLESSKFAGKTHLVRTGESLEKIAKKHGVSISDLKAWNKLRTNTIHIGDRLFVEAPSIASPPHIGPITPRGFGLPPSRSSF